MDFTIKQYKNLLRAIKRENFSFQTFNSFLEKPKERAIILRHDVDLLPQNSLRFAKIQHEFGIQGTYYFRAVPESWDEKTIIEITDVPHDHIKIATGLGHSQAKNIFGNDWGYRT